MSNGFNSYYTVKWFVVQKLANNIEVVLEDKFKTKGYYVEDGLIKSVLVFSPWQEDMWYVHEATKIDDKTIKTSKNAMKKRYDKASPIYQQIVTALVHNAILEE